MSPKDRTIAALELREPDDIVPTSELQFQMADELLGRDYYRGKVFDQSTGAERERMTNHNVELMLEICERLDYSITPSVGWLPDEQHSLPLLKRLGGDRYLVAAINGGTFGIPSGQNMGEFACWLHDDPEGAKAKATAMARDCVERAKRQVEWGVDLIALCTDYCFNDGPFLSPKMFREFVTPYLHQIVTEIKGLGVYVVIHTDGNIMPILDDLMMGGPHALHSLDPMAGVDIAQVKRLVGDRVALIGNVNCALLQIGSEDDLRESARYCLTHCVPGGGYIYCSSNVAFKGMILDRYFVMMEERQRLGRYPAARG